MNLVTIGLTGGIGSGKSIAGEYLKTWFPVIDSDHLVHKLYAEDQELIKDLVKVFGSACLKDGQVNRPYLRQIVFADKTNLAKLNKVVKPKITQLLLNLISEAKTKQVVTIFLIPLLFENNWQDHLDHVLLLGCQKDEQLKRLLNRDKTDLKTIESIVDSQMPLSLKREKCDYYIQNSGSLAQLYNSLDKWREKKIIKIT